MHSFTSDVIGLTAALVMVLGSIALLGGALVLAVNGEVVLAIAALILVPVVMAAAKAVMEWAA